MFCEHKYETMKVIPLTCMCEYEKYKKMNMMYRSIFYVENNEILFCPINLFNRTEYTLRIEIKGSFQERRN